MRSCTRRALGWVFGSGERTSSLPPLLLVDLLSGYLVRPSLGLGGWCLRPIIEGVRNRKQECLGEVDRPGARAAI